MATFEGRRTTPGGQTRIMHDIGWGGGDGPSPGDAIEAAKGAMGCSSMAVMALTIVFTLPAGAAAVAVLGYAKITGQTELVASSAAGLLLIIFALTLGLIFARNLQGGAR